MKPIKVVVGLSGGVDSSVAAQLLVERGYDVTGVFMRNWEDGSEHCTATEDLAAAERVAEKIGIPFQTVNFSAEYWRDVFEYFLAENRAGRTPNPDILCNKYVKFAAFRDFALSLGADYIATGHYAAVSEFSESSNDKISAENLNHWPKTEQRDENKLWALSLPTDTNKDQTYFLHQLDQNQIRQTIFPLASFTKSEIRNLARKYGFVTADKKDSTGICFIGKRNYTEFLSEYLQKKPGDMIDKVSGKKLGTHIGLSFYTIGQSKTLGIGGHRDFPEGKWFVIGKDSEKNELIVSQDESFLLGTTLQIKNMHWVLGAEKSARAVQSLGDGGEIFGNHFSALGKIRYRDEGEACEVSVAIDGSVSVHFAEPVRAITPGQSCVLYKDKICLGGGEIQ